MAVTHTFNVTAAGGSATLGPLTFTSTGTLGVQVDVAVPASTTNQEYDISIDVSQLSSIILYADGALTLKTNSTSAPDNTYVFAAGVPLFWSSTMPGPAVANIFAADVTKFYLTNAGASSVQLRGLVNATPV